MRTSQSSVAAGEAAPAGPVHSGPMGAVDRLLNAWEAAYAAAIYGPDYTAQAAARARFDLKTAAINVVGLNNTAGLGCNHRTVMSLIHAAGTWADVSGTPAPEREAAGEAAIILARAIRAARSRFFMQGAGG